MPRNREEADLFCRHLPSKVRNEKLDTAEVLADFTARLEALVGYCERIGALPILIVPPTNEADYEPSRSTLPPTVSGTERDRLVREFFEAQAWKRRIPHLASRSTAESSTAIPASPRLISGTAACFRTLA